MFTASSTTGEKEPKPQGTPLVAGPTVPRSSHDSAAVDKPVVSVSPSSPPRGGAAALATPVPRGPEDEPWNHPADGGAPLDGRAMCANDIAFGLFQTDANFADDVVQLMRKVYERMFRGGFRDWELEWDYVECSYWFIRRHLEVNAREAFRLWYGDGKWRGPFRRASRLQESGRAEYRIDHLLQSELGAEIRKRTEAHGSTRPAVQVCEHIRRRARYGELRDDLLKKAPEFMEAGQFLTAAAVASRLRARVEYQAYDLSVVYVLKKYPAVFATRTAPGLNSHPQTLYALCPQP